MGQRKGITLEFDSAGAQKRARAIGSKYQGAHQRAVASTRRKTSTIAKRAVVAQYAVRPGNVTRRITVRGTESSSGGEIAVFASTSTLSLASFGAKWNRRMRGATATIRRGRSEVFEGTFIGRRLGTGSKVVFYRLGRKRLPIAAKRGPAMFDMLTGTRYGTAPAGEIAAEARRYYVSELARLVGVANKGAT